MTKYLLILLLILSSYLVADYATYQEAQQTQQIKSLYSKAREVALDLEHKYNKILLENEQLKQEVKELKVKNKELQKELDKCTNRDSNSSEEAGRE